MCNVRNKSILATLLLGATLATLASCSGTSTADRARQLYDQAEALGKSANYDEALKLLDSLDHAYPEVVDVRRLGMQLRPRMIEQVTNLQLQTIDSLSAISAIRLDSLSKGMKLINNEIENYYVASDATSDSQAAGLHARMAADGHFYMIATSPRHIEATSLSVSAGGESASTPAVAFDGERNERSGKTDVITFIEAECDDVAAFIAAHKSEPITVTFSGGSTASMPLPENQRKAIASLYETSSLIRERKKQEIEKQRLTRLLDAARSQIARTTQVEE